ncbi:SIR2 family protein [Patescibacteria group bacterium]|nr:SIR2 family protein [Patescibacteria group bacterium]
MKKYNTVLILGAGASKPYGFPTQPELLTQIKSFLTSRHDFHTKLLEEKYLAPDIEELLQSLKSTQRDTIDDFLGAPVCKNNPAYTKIIKYAIAYALLAQETTEQIGNPDDWYKKLYDRIFGSRDDKFTDNIAIITFNYDRSLKEYLCRTHAAMQAMSIDDARESTLIKQIPIIHVHGKLSSSGYGGPHNFKTVVEASDGIIINTDKVTQDLSNEIIMARAIIHEATFIYILGFGYYDENMEKIGLNKRSPGIKLIKGTALNISRPRRNHITGIIPGIELVQTDSKQFLMDEWM